MSFFYNLAHISEKPVGLLWKFYHRCRAGFTPSGAPVQKKMWDLNYMNAPPPGCLHPTRTVVVIDILLRTRAAMHTTIAAAAVWQFEATQNRFLYTLIIISVFLTCYHVAKMKKMCFCGGHLFVGPKSASDWFNNWFTQFRGSRRRVKERQRKLVRPVMVCRRAACTYHSAISMETIDHSRSTQVPDTAGVSTNMDERSPEPTLRLENRTRTARSSTVIILDCCHNRSYDRNTKHV